jgi:hypothetical protein
MLFSFFFCNLPSRKKNVAAFIPLLTFKMEAMRNLKFFRIAFFASVLFLICSCEIEHGLPVVEEDAMVTVPFHAVMTIHPAIVSSEGNILNVAIPGEGEEIFLGLNALNAISHIVVNPAEAAWPEAGELEFTNRQGETLQGVFSGVAFAGTPEKPFSGSGTYDIVCGSGCFCDGGGSGQYSYAVNAEMIGTIEFSGCLSIHESTLASMGANGFQKW